MLLRTIGIALVAVSHGLALDAPRWWSAPQGSTPGPANPQPAYFETSYTTSAAFEAALSFHQDQLRQAGIAFSANPDGIGTTIRAAAPECDVLIQVRRRENPPSTFVKFACVAKVAGVPPTGASVAESSSSSRRLPSSRTLPRDPVASQMINAQRAKNQSTMEAYDRPVTRAQFAQMEGRPRPELPPLLWPHWLVHMPGADRPLAIASTKDQGGHPQLQSRFVTNVPMTQIHKYYEDMCEANGFPVAVSHLSTGQTLGGIMQNANGDLEGKMYLGGPGSGYTRVKVYMRRSVLNGPITVTLTVDVGPNY